jgi:hypothetical protein
MWIRLATIARAKTNPRPPTTYTFVWHPLLSHRVADLSGNHRDGRHQGGTVVQCRGRGAEGGHLQIWPQPVGSLRLAACKEDGKAVQGAMERMARPFVSKTYPLEISWANFAQDQEDRMVARRRRKALDHGQAATHTMAHDCAHRRTHGDTMFGAIPETPGRAGGARERRSWPGRSRGRRRSSALG